MSIFSGSSSDSNMQLGLEATSGEDWITCVLSLNWPSEACVCCVYLTLSIHLFRLLCIPKACGCITCKTCIPLFASFLLACRGDLISSRR